MSLRIPDSPYIGLVPYSEEEADFFVGRESETQIIIDNLRGARFTLLYGPTGVGKTSVLRAGVAHRLRELARENIKESGAPGFIVVVFNAWRDDPLAGLAECVRDSVALVTGDQEEAGEPPQARPLALTLKSWGDRTQSDLLIILDQFEEFFLYHEHERGQGTFDYEFPRAVNRPDLRVSFLVSVREDVLSKLDRFKGRIPNLFDNYLRIEHLSRKDAARAIREPLELYNRLKSPAVRYEIEGALVEAVCDQVRAGQFVVEQAGRGVVRGGKGQAPQGVERIEAPYLQLVMNTLWERETAHHRSHLLRRRTLDELGGAINIFKSHLNSEMNLLTSGQRDAAAKIFHHLVTPTGAKIAHTVEDLSAYTELPEEKIEPVLEAFAGGNLRLIRPVTSESGRGQITRYEIFHDVLVAAVLDWRARYVQEQEQEKVRQQEADLKLAAELEAQKQQRRARRRLYISGLATLVALLCLLLWLYARRQGKAAEEANRQLKSERARLATVADVVDKQDRAMPYFRSVMRGHASGVNAAAFSPDGTRLVTCSDDRTARVWESATGKMLLELPHHFPVGHVLFTSDGKRFITGTDDGKARVWGTESGRFERAIDAHEGPLTDLAVSPDGSLLATAGGNTARVWEVGTGALVGTLIGHTGAVNDINFSPDGSRVVTASDDYTARVWAARGGQSLRTLGNPGVAPGDAANTGVAPSYAFNSAAFDHRRGELVVAAGADGNVYLWEVNSGQLLAAMQGHVGVVNSAAFSPDGSVVASAGDDKTVRIWDVKTPRALHKLTGHTDAVSGVTFNWNGLRVISASADYTARVWDVGSGQPLFELRGHTGAVNSAAFSPDGNSAATASEDTTARVWNVTDSGGLRVSEVGLRVVPDKYVGQCPAAIRLLGSINVVGVSGTVRYRFARSDKDEPGVERTLTFDSPGTKEVSVVYRFGGRAFRNVSGAFHLDILSPQAVRSEDANFEVKCTNPLPERDAGAGATPTPSP